MGPFAGLVLDGQIPRVVRGIEEAVAKSFTEDAKRRAVIVVGAAPKQSEVKRRAEICLRIFRELRGDLKWGVERIADSLPHFLRCELDGIAWSPTVTRASWSPNDKITREDTSP